jgi:hypothetical protein
MRRAAFVIGLLLTVAATPAFARTAATPWPPAGGPGSLYAHYGEEHITDVDGSVVLPKVVAEVIRYRPALVTMSGDKTDDGTEAKLVPWRDLMVAYDRAGIPYMAGVGNHDGKQPTPEAVTDASAGSTPLRDITFYKRVFASRPYPMGDAAPYPGLAPAGRPAGDPTGAATHFWVDHGNVRWIFLDNSCYGIVNCDPLQNPPDDSGRDQYTFLRDAATEAGRAGKLVFVVAHMPTRDPRDQRNAYSTSVNHTMGKGSSPDNQRLEEEAAALGVDGVFVGHIKGQFLYKGAGGVPFYVDGGAGGELYSSGPVGVDHGYWYGFRLIRVDGTRVETDTVPVILPDGISVDGPRAMQPGERPVRFLATARQPAAKSTRAVVAALELRDPDPVPRPKPGIAIPWAALAWLAPLTALGLMALRLQPRRILAPAILLGGVMAVAAVAVAQQSAPDDTPRESLPNPARIYTSGSGLVLSALASESDDRRRDPLTQTADGRFTPRCPGRTTMTVTAGWEETAIDVVVRSRPGARIVRSIDRRGRRSAVVRLAQPAVVRVTRGKRALSAACVPAGRHVVSLGRRRGAVTVRVESDRRAVVKRLRVR